MSKIILLNTGKVLLNQSTILAPAGTKGSSLSYPWGARARKPHLPALLTLSGPEGPFLLDGYAKVSSATVVDGA